MESPHTDLSTLKMTDLANALGLKLSSVSRVIHGNRLSISIGQAIADHIGKPLEEVFPAIHEKKLRRESARVPFRQHFETEPLRKEVKKLMIDLDIGYNAAMNVLIDGLSQRTGRRISRQTIGYALTGSRRTWAYYKLLVELKAMLEAWPPDKAA